MFFYVSLPLGRALGRVQISSDSRRSECVISHGNTHESHVVYRHSFAVYRPLGDGSAFDTMNHVESDVYRVAVCVLFRT